MSRLLTPLLITPIERWSSEYSLNLTAEVIRKLTEYIIKDSLQYGCEARYFPVMKYGQGMEQLRIRLIDDKLIDDQRGYVLNYRLTFQGYDFPI